MHPRPGGVDADPTKRCGVCAGTALLRERGLSGFQQPAVFDVFQCLECNAAFCDPLEVVDGIYDRIYVDPALVRGYDRYPRYRREVLRERSPLRFLADSEDIYWGIERLLPAISEGSGRVRILDVGCGQGYLTFALRSAGYDAVGIDISDKAVATARDQFGGDYRSSTLRELAESGERFDAVVMAELVEHVVDPTGLVREGLEVLADEGRLIVTTPNRSAYGPDVVWTGDLPPIHLWWLSEESLRVIARTVECEIEFVDYSKFNETHLVPMSEGWCSPRVGETALDPRGTPRRRAARAEATARIVRGLVEAVHMVGLTTLARRVRNRVLRRRANGWATGPRRMTMAASLSRRP
jgi:SAM-dependent methyltransferase